MKAFEFFNEDFQASYPEDFKEIKKYLDSKGIINVSDERLDYMYSDFSEDMYSADWVCVVSSYNGSIDYELLDEFAHWLAKKSL